MYPAQFRSISPSHLSLHFAREEASLLIVFVRRLGASQLQGRDGTNSLEYQIRLSNIAYMTTITVRWKGACRCTEGCGTCRTMETFLCCFSNSQDSRHASEERRARTSRPSIRRVKNEGLSLGACPADILLLGGSSGNNGEEGCWG